VISISLLLPLFYGLVRAETLSGRLHLAPYCCWASVVWTPCPWLGSELMVWRWAKDLDVFQACVGIQVRILAVQSLDKGYGDRAGTWHIPNTRLFLWLVLGTFWKVSSKEVFLVTMHLTGSVLLSCTVPKYLTYELPEFCEW